MKIIRTMKMIFLLGLLAAVMTGNAPAQAVAPDGGQLLSATDYGKIIKCAVRDRAGNLWFGTSWAGAFRYDGKAFVRVGVKEGLPTDMVNAIHEDRSGVLWFGTDRGVYRYEDGRFSLFPLQVAAGVPLFGARAPQEDATPTVTSIAQDRAGNLWFGLWGPPGSAGAYRYDGRRLTRFRPEKPTQGILADGNGGVWLNSMRYDGQGFTDFSGREHAFREAVFCSLADREGNLWFGVRDNGLYRYDGKAFTWYPASAGTFERVTCLFQDKAGRVWVGGDIRHGTDKGGLCYYDGKSFVPFPQVSDLGLYGVWAAAEDADGNLWFAGRGGKLVRYDGKGFTDFSGSLDGS